MLMVLVSAFVMSGYTRLQSYAFRRRLSCGLPFDRLPSDQGSLGVLHICPLSTQLSQIHSM